MSWFVRAAVGLALIACIGNEACSSDDKKTAVNAAVPCTPAQYPAAPYGTALNATLGNRVIDGLRADGSVGQISFADYSASCGVAKPLVIRVVASFCGPCQASARHSTDAIPQAVRDKANIVDILVRDEDSAPPDVAAATRWQAKQELHTDVGIDGQMELVVDNTKLPRVLVVDPTTMKIVADMADPSPDDIATAVGVPPPAVPLVDGRFTAAQWDMIQEMVLSGAPPADPTNAVGDSDLAAEFGSALFKDKGLSPSAEVSCARCHDADREFTDAADKATGGVGPSTRNTPTVLLTAWSPWQFWDGRADSLWMQALGPMENPNEFGSTRNYVAQRIVRFYHDQYEAIFGPLPFIDDTTRFPPSGMPGQPQYDAMAQADKDTITQIFVNVGKAMAAYERSFRTLPNLLDSYASGNSSALTDVQKDGLRDYFAAGCAQCHFGSRLTDDSFHALRFPSGNSDFTADNGRIDAKAKYDASEFRADERWSDAPQARRQITTDPAALGSFKTPALRGVILTAPYGHGGGVPTLDMAIDLHRTRGFTGNQSLTNGTADPWDVAFTEDQAKSILNLVQILDFVH